jgi:hypothetical protein
MKLMMITAVVAFAAAAQAGDAPDFNNWTTESLKVIFVRKIAITRVHGRIKTVTFSPGPMDGGYPTEFHAYDGFYLLCEFLRGPHADFTSDYTMYSGRDNAGHIIQTDSETPYTVTRDDYVPPAKWRYHFTVTKTGIPDIPILTAEVIPSERLGPQIILHISDPAN